MTDAEMEALNAEFSEVMRAAVRGVVRIAEDSRAALRAQQDELCGPSYDTMAIVRDFHERAKSLSAVAQMVEIHVRRMLAIEQRRQDERGKVGAELARIAAEGGEV